MMIVEIGHKEIEVEEEDIDSLLEVLNKNRKPEVEPVTAEALKEILVSSFPEIHTSVEKIHTSVEKILTKMTSELTEAVKSIPPVVIPEPKEQPRPEPVKRIVVTDIERNVNGYITTCILKVQR